MFDYKPTESGLKLHQCNSYLKMIVGPYGSGKSCACAVDVLACPQDALSSKSCPLSVAA